MTDASEGKGSCLCGSVAFTTTSMPKDFGACHCSMCRKWTGGPFMSVFCGSDVQFKGEEYISVYDSSQWAERGFCKKCGSALFYRIKGNQQYHMPLGLFENAEDMSFTGQVFIDKKPDFYSFANKTKNMTEAEIFEKYGS